jgi:hypothetical protein
LPTRYDCVESSTHAPTPILIVIVITHATQVEVVALAASATPRARYYCAVCCAQLRYRRGDRELATRNLEKLYICRFHLVTLRFLGMVLMYLRVFGAISQRSIDQNGRTLAALLSVRLDLFRLDFVPEKKLTFERRVLIERCLMPMLPTAICLPLN